MRVFISVDMEGIAGVATLDQVVRGGAGYPRAQELMTAEVNAAIAGAFEAGAEAVDVNDSHGTMDNLIAEALDERATVVLGRPKAQCMAHGLDPAHDIALFVGYHAPAGGSGVLAHSFSSFFTDLRLNGATVSETEVNALFAASYGVPVGLVTGDDVICQLAEHRLPGARTVPVKKAEGWSAASSVHPRVAGERIRQAAAQAVQGASELTPARLPHQLVLEVDMEFMPAAELAAGIPGAKLAGRTVRLELDHPADVLGTISVCYSLAAQATRTRTSLFNRL